MLKKRARGVSITLKCENCGKKFSVLYEKNGKKICKTCLEGEKNE